ncbi:SIMPL domain-containing protein [bacterium]|nr:SIMPL domain-containing protein [bacterium]
MKKILTLAILCLMINSSVLSSYAVTGTETKKEAGIISLNNTITKEIEPNIATITFAVENTANEAKKAASENNEISNKIINALKAISSTQTDTIKTTNFSVRPVYTTSATGKRTIKNYMAVNSVKVETKDIKKVANFIDTAISNGANRTDNLNYSLQNEKTICRELYPSLVKELRLTASEIATATGSSLDGLKQLNVSCNTDSAVSNGRFYSKSMVAMDAMSEAPIEPTPVEAGKIKIRVYVNADFYVK